MSMKYSPTDTPVQVIDSGPCSWHPDTSTVLGTLRASANSELKRGHPLWTLQCSPPYLKHSLEARRILKLWPSHSLSRWRVLRWRKAYTSQKEGVIFPQQQGCRKAELLQTHCKGRLECPPLPMCARQGILHPPKKKKESRIIPHCNEIKG